jgi:hypothetical protein
VSPFSGCHGFRPGAAVSKFPQKTGTSAGHGARGRSRAPLKRHQFNGNSGVPTFFLKIAARMSVQYPNAPWMGDVFENDIAYITGKKI